MALFCAVFIVHSTTPTFRDGDKTIELPTTEILETTKEESTSELPLCPYGRFLLNAGFGLLKIVNFSCPRSSCYRRTSKHVSQYRHDIGDNHASVAKLTVETTMKATTKKSEKRKICFCYKLHLQS
jgi:hypothetical protein